MVIVKVCRGDVIRLKRDNLGNYLKMSNIIRTNSCKIQLIVIIGEVMIYMILT